MLIVSRPEGLNLPTWSELGDGRTTTLGCEKLMAGFAEPADEPNSKDTTGTEAGRFDAASRIGPLEFFTATRDVTLRDGSWELQGQSLMYNRRQGLAVLWGYLEGQPLAKAHVLDQGRPVSSPKFHCYLDGGHIKRVEVQKVTGAGGR